MPVSGVVTTSFARATGLKLVTVTWAALNCFLSASTMMVLLVISANTIWDTVSPTDTPWDAQVTLPRRCGKETPVQKCQCLCRLAKKERVFHDCRQRRRRSADDGRTNCS